MWSTFWAPGHWFMTCHRKSGSGYPLALVITMTMYSPLSPDWMVLPDHGASKQACSNTKIISLSRIILFKHWPCHDPAMTLVWFPFRRAAGSLRGSVQFHLCTRHSWSTRWKGHFALQRGSGQVVRFLGSIHLGEYLENLWSCLKKLLFS